MSPSLSGAGCRPKGATISDPRDDHQLIADANEGDPSAFEALYYRYRDWAASLAWRWTGNHEDALDVLQDAFAYFFGKFPGFRLTAQLKTFLYPSVKNLSLARVRKRRPQTDLETAEPMLPAVPPDESRTAELDLHDLLASLSQDQREIILLRFVDGLSLAEIAKSLDIPLGTAKSRLHNALETLREKPQTKRHFC